MKISRIYCHVLLDPGYDSGSTSSAQDDIVVEIHTNEGVTGIGETDVNPWMARACIEAPGTHTMGLGLTDMLMGADPLDVEAIWERLYTGSAMNGRRGLVINAIGALDMALHDLRGKALGKPCFEMLGGARRKDIVPYASLQPELSSFEAYRDSLTSWALDAQRRGFGAAKLEVTPSGPYAHKGMQIKPAQATEVLAGIRHAVGPDFVLMVDVQYAFPDADSCLAVIKDWERFNLFFIETPLPSDDLAGYARLAEEQSIPIAAGEWLTTRFEFLDLMDRGKVSVVQPDIGRVGGLTEAKRVCDLAAERGVKVVPHAWKSGISIAAAAHLAAATPHLEYFEFLPKELCDSVLRKELVTDEIEIVNGRIPLPTRPGLGIELNRQALHRFEQAASRVFSCA